MKKLITIILILALILPGFAAADDSDIIGCWYVLLGLENLSEADRKEWEESLWTSHKLYEVHVLQFSEDGEIHRIDGFFDKHGSEANDYNTIGTWVYRNGKYQSTIIGAGTGEIVLEDGKMFILYTQNEYFGFNRMILIDNSTDIRKAR